MLEATKTILDVENIPLVEVSFMNDTHFEEVGIVKNLSKLVSVYQEKNSHTDDEMTQISQALNGWSDHTILHFKRENELMQKTGFPAYSVHSEEHEIALKKMKTMIQAWKQNQDIELVAEYIFTLWPAWFHQHVNTMDMMTAKFAKINGFVEGN